MDTGHAGVSPDRPEPRAVEKGTLNDVSSMLAALTDVILKQRGLRDGCLKEIQDSSLPSLENGQRMSIGVAGARRTPRCDVQRN